jgi:sec-independent protein translocase protein TatB
MLDLGLTKLAVIGTVALIVIGPKDLPKVARMAGSLLGRAQRYLSQVKSEVNREIELEELRKMQKDVEGAAHKFQQDVEQEVQEMEQDWAQHQNAYAHFDQALSPTALQEKARQFRRRKLAKTSNIPLWYKARHGHRSQVISGAARMAKYRAQRPSSHSFF